MIVSRREEEVVSIMDANGGILSVRVIRARNGAVSLALDLPPGYGLCTGAETDCDGRVRIRTAVTPTECSL